MQPIAPLMIGASDPTAWRSSPALAKNALAAVEPAAVNEQRLMAVIERRPLDRLLIEVQSGDALGDPVEQFEAISVALIHLRLPSG